MLFRALPAAILAMGSTAVAQPPPIPTSAPPLRYIQAAERHDLGSWDDVFVAEEVDRFLLRRGSDLFALSITASGANPGKLVTSSALANAQIVTCAEWGPTLWVFFNSNRRAPFALDAHSGKLAEFEIPGLKISENNYPVIQSHVITGHADAAILMISGTQSVRDRDENRTTWPRDGNRPLYFWMNLKSGAVVALPVGWDLDYFSADQQTAVFGHMHEKQFERKAISVRTGASVTEIPDRHQVPVGPFTWTDTEPGKPLYVRRDKTGDADYLAGISWHELVVLFGRDFEAEHYMSAPKVNDGFAGFRLRRSGATPAAPNSFWLAPLVSGQKPEVAATEVTDFVMLGRGNTVFAAAGPGRKGLSTEAFFRNRKEKTRWNVFDGIEPRTPQEKEVMEKAYVGEQMTVRLIEAFGGDSHDRPALCLFSHSPGDLRDTRLRTPFSVLPAPFLERPVQTEHMRLTTWHRALIVTTGGQRYMTDILREANLPDQIWLHGSGRVIAANSLWTSVGSEKKRTLQLSETALPLDGSTPGK